MTHLNTVVPVAKVLKGLHLAALPQIQVTNGATFFFAVPVTDAPTISTFGNSVSGNWRSGLGEFHVAADCSEVNLCFNSEEFGFRRSIVMKN